MVSGSSFTRSITNASWDRRTASMTLPGFSLNALSAAAIHFAGVGHANVHRRRRFIKASERH